MKKDLATARDLYTAAAAKGNGKAMHNLAVLYAEGVNGPADYRTAAQWFRKAADHGITDSQYNLAILYARGIGVEQNYAEAYKWFALGANAGRQRSGQEARRDRRPSRPAIARGGASRGAEMEPAAAAGRRDQRQDAAWRLGSLAASGEAQAASGWRQAAGSPKHKL